MLAVPTTVKVTSLPAGALSLAVILKAASPAPRTMFVELMSMPSGTPSTARLMSSVNQPRRLAFTLNSASLAADFFSGGDAVRARRGRGFASVNGTPPTGEGLGRLEGDPVGSFTLDSPVTRTIRAAASESAS